MKEEVEKGCEKRIWKKKWKQEVKEGIDADTEKQREHLFWTHFYANLVQINF